jgi:hypothetical protein
MMQICEMQVFCGNARKAFCFLVMLVLLMVCNGCFTEAAQRICYRCHDDIQIIERRGEVSNDGKSLSIHLKKRKDYCRDPFGIWKGSVEEEETYAYPLTSPEPKAERMQFSIVLDSNCTQRVSMQHLEVKDERETDDKDVIEADYNRLILPVFEQIKTIVEIEGKKDDCIIRIHPDDLPYLSHPFVYKYWGYYPYYYRLVIPYKKEDDVCHVYLPKKGLIVPSKMPNKPNISTHILGTFFKPLAVLLDVLTFPLQAIYVVYEGAD